MPVKKRSAYIDVMKGLLIILVIIGHLPYFDYDSRTLVLIYSFHMPAFLIIGGMLSHIDNNTKFSTIIIKRVKGTLYPYIIFSIITFFIMPVGTKERAISGLTAALRGIGDPVNSLNLPLWFLTFYFVVMITFEIIEWLSYRIRSLFSKSNSYLPIAIIDILIIIPIMTLTYIYARVLKLPRIPFNVEIAHFCLLFVYVGKLIGVYIKDSLVKINGDGLLTFITAIISTVALIIVAIYWYRFSMRNGRIDLNARDYKDAFFMYVDAFLGFFIFAYFSYIISLIPFINKILACIGENSMYVFAYNVPANFYINTFILPLLPQIVSITLAHNSIMSVALYTSLILLYSLCLALIHKSIRHRT